MIEMSRRAVKLGPDIPETNYLRAAPMFNLQLILRRFGESEALRAAILDGVGVSGVELDDPRTELRFTQQMRQFDNMNRLFGEGWMLDAPDLWRPAAHGALGVAVVSSPNVGTAAEVLARYIRARAPNQRLKLGREPGALVLRHSVGEPLSESHDRISAESVLLSVGSMLGTLLGAAIADVRFDFIWDRPAYGRKLEEALGGQVHWGARTNAVAVPRHLLSLTSPMADSVMHHAALEQLDQSLRVAAAPEGVKARVERLLAHSETGRLSGAVAARALGLSQRTLVRRLSDSGVSYRDLVDAELKARARRLLDGGGLSRAEIAERLGFADATGFSRASRRWFKG